MASNDNLSLIHLKLRYISTNIPNYIQKIQKVQKVQLKKKQDISQATQTFDTSQVTQTQRQQEITQAGKACETPYANLRS